MVVMLGLSGLPAIAFDQALVGSWTSVVNRVGRILTLNWDVYQDGSYHLLIRGPTGVLEERGQMMAEGGQWSLMSMSRRQDRGYYNVQGPNQVNMMGMAGPSQWVRSGAPAAAGGTPAAGAPSTSADNPPPITPDLMGNAPDAGKSAPAAPPAAPTAALAPPPPAGAVPPMPQTPGFPYPMPGAPMGMGMGMGMGMMGAFANPFGGAPIAPPAVPSTGTPRPPAAATKPGTAAKPKVTHHSPNESLFGKTATTGSAPVASLSEVEKLVQDNFPLAAAQDEVDQFCVPALGKAVGAGVKVPAK